MALSPLKKPTKDELKTATGKAQEAARTANPRLTAGAMGRAITGVGKRLGTALQQLSPRPVQNAALRTAGEFEQHGVPGAAGRSLARGSSPEAREAVLRTGADIREQGVGATLGKSLVEQSSPETLSAALATNDMLTNFGSGLTPGAAGAAGTSEQPPDVIDVGGALTPTSRSAPSDLGSLENLNDQIAAIRGLPSTVKPGISTPQFSVTPSQRKKLLRDYKSDLEDIMSDSKRGKITAKGTANAIAAAKLYYGEALGLTPQEEEAGKDRRLGVQTETTLARQSLANKGGAFRQPAKPFQARELGMGEDLQPTLVGFNQETGETQYPAQVQGALDQYLQSIQSGVPEEQARQKFQASYPGTDPRLL